MEAGSVVASVEGTPQGWIFWIKNWKTAIAGTPMTAIYTSAVGWRRNVRSPDRGLEPEHLRLKVNAVKSGTGKVWERKFLGFRLCRDKRIGVAPENVERFKAKVHEKWDGRQSRRVPN